VRYFVRESMPRVRSRDSQAPGWRPNKSAGV
jgi:hypothetical protein